LSGLANRRRFLRKLDTLIRTDDDANRRFYVGIIDIDGFRAINDVYGYSAGDRVLSEVAKRLRQSTKGRAIVARYDGDEFAFLLTMTDDDEEAKFIAQRLCNELEAPYAIAGQAAHLTASCGLSTYPNHGTDAETLINRAYYALHHVKDDDNRQLSIFAQEHENEIQERSRIEQALRRAMTTDGFTVAFQPIVDLRTGKTVTCEALARWHDEELGVVSPAKFIPIAEQSGLISELTYTLLEEAARQATTWPKGILLSFNISALEVIKPSAGLRILSILNDVGLDSRRLEVEITETAFLNDFEAANATLKGLRGAGVRVALDDFGTGQSSLQYVEKIEIDKLKIDRAFVSSVANSARTRHIVEAIADMCNRLEISTVAEGVEDIEQSRIMAEIGCTYGQGYLFAPPLDQENLAAYFDLPAQNNLKSVS
jgi:diguanylate cyclase (GGDEF)-like protein